ncbi:MAG: hypothetical protein U1F48_00915 [Burkholderiales bacterium]
MAIAVAYQKGHAVYVKDAQKRTLQVHGTPGIPAVLQGYTASTVTLRKGHTLYTYDARGAVISSEIVTEAKSTHGPAQSSIRQETRNRRASTPSQANDFFDDDGVVAPDQSTQEILSHEEGTDAPVEDWRKGVLDQLIQDNPPEPESDDELELFEEWIAGDTPPEDRELARLVRNRRIRPIFARWLAASKGEAIGRMINRRVSESMLGEGRASEDLFARLNKATGFSAPIPKWLQDASSESAEVNQATQTVNQLRGPHHVWALTLSLAWLVFVAWGTHDPADSVTATVLMLTLVGILPLALLYGIVRLFMAVWRRLAAGRR